MMMYIICNKCLTIKFYTFFRRLWTIHSNTISFAALLIAYETLQCIYYTGFAVHRQIIAYLLIRGVP